MGLMFLLGMPLLPPRAKIKAWGLGGLEKQLRMKDIFVDRGSAGVCLAGSFLMRGGGPAVAAGPRRAGDGCASLRASGAENKTKKLQLA